MDDLAALRNLDFCIRREVDEARLEVECIYFADEEYLVTALVPSDTACLASSPGRISRTDVWISREEIVDFLL